MKSTVKVFLVLSILWGAFSIVIGIANIALDATALGITNIISGIVCIVVSFLALRRLNRAQNRRDLIGMAILTLFCANIFAGVLMLTMNEYELGSTNPPIRPTAPYGQQPYGQQPYGQQPYGQQPYGQQPPYYAPNMPPYGGIYGAPYAAPKTEQVPVTPAEPTPTEPKTVVDTPLDKTGDVPTDTSTDIPTDVASGSPTDTPSDGDAE